MKSELRQALEDGRFPVALELKPPRGADASAMLAPVGQLKGRVTAFGAPDNHHARLGLSPLAAGRLVQEAGGEVLLHLTCRDRNRLALQSDLLGAAALGLNNLLLVSGDYVTLGDHPDAKPVYDADSVQLLALARGLMAGQDSVGQFLAGAPDFFLGAVLIPEADPAAPQLLKFRKKVSAGAQFFITPPVFKPGALRDWRPRLEEAGVKLLASVKVLGPEALAQLKAGQWRKVYGVPDSVLQELAGKEGDDLLMAGAALAGRLLKQIKSDGLAHGAYLKVQGRADLAAAVLDAAGL
jgi:5,10-methylenetetrahydrofolate reductase